MAKKLEMVKYVCVTACYYRDKKWAVNEKMEAEPLVEVPQHFITSDKHANELIQKRKAEAEAEKSVEEENKLLREKIASMEKTAERKFEKTGKDDKKNKINKTDFGIRK